MSYHCTICGYIYDEESETPPFNELPDSWACPICGMGKNVFILKQDKPTPTGTLAPKEASPSQEPAPSFHPSASTTQTKSDILIQQLHAEGLRWIFGMVGHSNLGIAEALRQHNPDQAPDGIRFIGIRHEGAAAFAAAAYGKLTHRPAACLSIAGPGATNMSTGIADALLDHAPLLALMGQVPSTTLDQHIFQELDLAACFAPLTHDQYTLREQSHSASLAQQAYHSSLHAQVPVQIILPDDTQKQPPHSDETTHPHLSPVTSLTHATTSAISDAADALRHAKNPCIIVGHGAEHALTETLDLAELLQAPLSTTYRAKGYIPDSHPLACGVIGLSGTPISHHFVSEADLILTLGVGFARHSAIPTCDNNGVPKHIIRLDRAPLSNRPLPPITQQLIGDCAGTLKGLLAELQTHDELASTSPGIQSKAQRIALEWEQWRAEKARRALPIPDSDTPITPAAVCDALNQSLPPRALLSIDVGNVAYQIGRYLESSQGQRYLLSWYLGSIGVGLPAAIGAYAATCEEGPWKDRPIIALVGDGGLGQYLAEISTIAKYQLPIKIIVFNNGELGKITREQTQAHYPTWETTLINPDFAQLATSCGITGVTITNPAELLPTLKKHLHNQTPTLINIHTNPTAS